MSNQTGKEKKSVSGADISEKITIKDIATKESEKSAEVPFATWIRSLMQNWRQGTVGVKGRADVAKSGKKPWKQKGTGRARAGTARSPLWRGGGVTHGPQARVKKLKVPKAFKKLALNAILFDYLKNGKIVSLDWKAENDTPKTKQAVKGLKEAGLINKKIVLFLPKDDMISAASFANIPKVKMLSFDQANAFDLVNSEYWVVLKKDFDKFNEMVSKWT